MNPFDDLPEHQVRVTSREGQRVWLECPDCEYTALWDGETWSLNRLLRGDAQYAHSGSW